METISHPESLNNSDAPIVRTLTRKQASEQLQISVSMLDLLTKKGRIRVCKIGRRRVYLPSFLEELIYCDGHIESEPNVKVDAAARIKAPSPD